MSRSSVRIGLALSGGGARGWAHIGVIRCLQQHGWSFSCVAGTSMGALVGAALAAGRLPELHEAATALDWKQTLLHFMEISRGRGGLIDGTRILRTLRRWLGNPRIEALPLPYAALATDILTGSEIVLRSGPLLEAVRASIAIPGLFTPIRHGPYLLLDGGLVNPLPVDRARELGAEYVIAVDVLSASLAPAAAARLDREAARTRAERRWPRLSVSASTPPWLRHWAARIEGIRPPPRPRRDARTVHDLNLLEVFGHAARIVQRQILQARLALHPPDLLITPDVGDIGTMDFHRAAPAIEAGARAAEGALQRLPADHPLAAHRRRDGR